MTGRLPTEDRGFLSGGGAMGELIAKADWGRTPLGPIESWPRSLKTAVQIMLTSRYAMWLGWGPQLTFMWNDAYSPTLGVKYPGALGKPAREVWAEIWSDIGPRIETVLTTGHATWDEALLLFLERSGFPEETYHTFSYSPLSGDDAQIAGMLCVVTEETERVIAARRLALLREVAARTWDATTVGSVFELSAVALHADRQDIPFALLYSVNTETGMARREALAGISAEHAAAPLTIALTAPEIWPLGEAVGQSQPLLVNDLAIRFSELPRGVWDTAPDQAVILPLGSSSGSERQDMAIIGLNPYRKFDESYASFVSLVAGQIGTALANVRAREEERKRREALAELDRAKTAFFSNVSHEFRTPLTLMLGPLEEALAVPQRPAEDRSLIATAHRNGLRLLKLVNSMLDFSRIEAGRVRASYQRVDLAQLTADLASNFSSQMERAGLSFAIVCEPLPGTVYVDSEMWEKIVLNLLSNAFKFTLRGKVEITLHPSTDGRMAELEVKDTGTGIAPHELPRLFERFHRVAGAGGRTFEGTGIGLALVQELVKLHGGQIDVESELDKGSVFKVSLPFGKQHLPEEQVDETGSGDRLKTKAAAFVEEALRWLPPDGAVSSSTDAVSTDRHAGSPSASRILLADDNADMRDYVDRLLTAAGYEVEAVADGETALAAAQRDPPDLILSDVMMPRLDGFGLVRAVRDDHALRNTAIVLLSARAGEEARVEGLGHGADDYLIKPFSARELLARIGNTLQLTALRRERERTLETQTSALSTLLQVNIAVAAELDLEKAVQKVTDAATQLTDAAFGSFFYNVTNERGESYMLYTLSGVPRSAFDGFPMPRSTKVFAPTFNGEGVVRAHDITKDPRYGQSAPHHGMPEGHLPVRSYLAAPVVSRSGEVAGGLFFGHPEPGHFSVLSEQIVAGIASQAAIAIDNARLFQANQRELAERARVEGDREALLESFRDLNNSLEQRVAERTRELADTNQKLIAQVRERERAEQALYQSQKLETIGQLTGGVAHDFNNLLMIIMGNLETIQRGFDQDNMDLGRIRRALDHTRLGAQRAAKLTQSLLAFSRRQPLDPKPADLNTLVSDMAELLHRTLGEQIHIAPVLASDLWTTKVDANQLEAAILNLAVNARDAMPKGGRLTIETANTHIDTSRVTEENDIAPGQYVVVCVTDTGHGMSQEVVSRAFEPFFTTKDVGHGTGLGLSQVYGFVKQSGGHIEINSQVGQGTSVKIYFPRLHDAKIAADHNEGPAKVPFSVSAETVLVVEDDDLVRSHTREIVSELGYKVLEAASGAQALRTLDANPDIDLLFSDIGLPGGMDGQELGHEAMKRKPGLKVLLTTGYARGRTQNAAESSMELITKPFGYAALGEKLRRILTNGKRKRRALIVEDEALIRMVLADYLQTLGYQVEEAGTAQEAVDCLERGASIDVAIVDIGLPDRSGDQLAKELRAINPNLPLIVASGYGENARKDRFSADALFLNKPYDMKALEDVLARSGLGD